MWPLPRLRIFLLPALICAESQPQFRNSVKSRKYEKYPKLQRENVQFQDYDKIVYQFAVDGRVHTGLELNKKSFSGSRLNNSYWRSVINVAECTFTKCFAIGAGITFGAGGGLYAQQSNLHIEKSVFNGNYANQRGSLSAVNSYLIIEGGCQFTGEHATQRAGSLYILFSNQPSEVDPEGEINTFENHVSIINSKFSDCSSAELYAACYFYKISDVYVYKCEFYNNKARHTGGTLTFSDCTVGISDTKFENNICGNLPTEADELNTFKKKRINTALRLPMGGAAILFSMKESISQSLDSNLVTQYCCFNGNVVNYADSGNQRNSNAAVGHDVLFDGTDITWRSYVDTFKWSESDSIAASPGSTFTLAVCNTTFQVIRDCVTEANQNPNAILTSPPDPPGNNNINFDATAVMTDPSFTNAGNFPTEENTITPWPDIGVQTIQGPRTTIFWPFPTVSMTPAPTPTLSISPTPSMSVSATPSMSISPTPSMSVSATPSLSVSPTASPSESPTPSFSIDPRYPTSTPRPTTTPSASRTATVSVSPTPSLSVSPSRSVSSTPSMSVSATPSRSVSSTPSRSVSSTPSRSISPTPTHSISPTSSLSVSQSATQSATLSETNEPTVSPDPTPIVIPPSPTPEPTQQSNNIEETKVEESGFPPFIYAIIGAIAAAALIIGILIFCMARRKDADSDILEDADTVLGLVDDQNAIVKDNPLWMTSVMGETDDPFQEDFEEEARSYNLNGTSLFEL